MPRVLIADDDPDNRHLLAAVLRLHAYDVVSAPDGRAAAGVIGAGGLDAALLDIRMPWLSGIDLCYAVRREPATATLPIMLISAHSFDDHVAAGLAAGANDYVIKPFDRWDLVTRLTALIPATADDTGTDRRPVEAGPPAGGLSPALLATLAARPAIATGRAPGRGTAGVPITVGGGTPARVAVPG